jgi:hypothetical protein
VVEVANADDDHIGFGLDDAQDGMLEGVQENRANHSAGFALGTYHSSFGSTVVTNTEPSARTTRFSRK